MIRNYLRILNTSRLAVGICAIVIAMSYAFLAYAGHYSAKNGNTGWPSQFPGRIVELRGDRLIVHTPSSSVECPIPANIKLPSWVGVSASGDYAVLRDNLDARLWDVKSHGDQELKVTMIKAAGKRLTMPWATTVVKHTVTAYLSPQDDINKLTLTWTRKGEPGSQQIRLWSANNLQRVFSIAPVPQDRPGLGAQLMVIPDTDYILVKVRGFKNVRSWIYAVNLSDRSAIRLPIESNDIIWMR